MAWSLQNFYCKIVYYNIVHFLDVVLYKYGNTGSYTSFILFYSAHEKFVRALHLEHKTSV